MDISVGSTTALERYRRQSRRSLEHAEQSHQRLDIQGLRMVAVLLVFATHLCGWPRGGFIGVDVFFVISGFLITGNLLRTAEKNGNVSFSKFYWNRVRRIVPAATAVLVLTYLASVVVFLPFRAHQVGADALSAFFFVSNWRFAFQKTDYFAAGDAVSPIQHYWSLSVEEQFYFIWPALIFAIGLIIARKSWTHGHRTRIARTVMGAVVGVSLGWALYETAVSPTWAYFNTFTRVWELGVGALLATSVGALARIPVTLKPWLSWAGLGLIAASAVLIAERSSGFPAPWALLPVAGSSMVIAAGVGGEPDHQGFLRNQIAVYIGNISYSLYLVHWPVIVLLGAFVTARDGSFYLAVVALAFGLAIASYHLVENPLRYGSWSKTRNAVREARRGSFEPARATRYAFVATLTLLTLGLSAFLIRPVSPPQVPPVTAAEAKEVKSPSQTPIQPVGSTRGPLGKTLQQQIGEALKATQWPSLSPSMESVIGGPQATPEVGPCGRVETPGPQACTWGSPTATKRIVLVGDSIAMIYAGPLRELALNSNGQIQLRVEALAGCPFANDQIKNPENEQIYKACPGRKQRAVDVINSTRPDVVIIANHGNWADSMPQLVDKFRASTKKIVFLAPPPEGRNPAECYSKSSVPADCISNYNIGGRWLAQAAADQDLAKAFGGVWIDSSSWFCNDDGLCPAFVGSTPMRVDLVHMTPDYGKKITPVIGESLTNAGLI